MTFTVNSLRTFFVVITKLIIRFTLTNIKTTSGGSYKPGHLSNKYQTKCVTVAFKASQRIDTEANVSVYKFTAIESLTCCLLTHDYCIGLHTAIDSFTCCF